MIKLIKLEEKQLKLEEKRLKELFHRNKILVGNVIIKKYSYKK